MTMVLGALTFPAAEEPDTKSELRFDGGNQLWSKFNPLLSNATILTYMGQESEPHTLHGWASLATKNSLKTIYDNRAVVTFTHDYGADDVLVTGLRIKAHPIVTDYYEYWIELTGGR